MGCNSDAAFGSLGLHTIKIYMRKFSGKSFFITILIQIQRIYCTIVEELFRMYILPMIPKKTDMTFYKLRLKSVKSTSQYCVNTNSQHILQLFSELGPERGFICKVMFSGYKA